MLVAAFTYHILYGLIAVYRRTSYRMTTWEGTQIGLGLSAPLMLSPHLATAFVAQLSLGYNPTYEWIVAYYFVVAPVEGVLTGLGMLVLWAHGVLGLHYWLRVKQGYADWSRSFLAAATAIPVAAFGGVVSAGAEAVRLSQDPGFLEQAFIEMRLTPEGAEIVRAFGDNATWMAAAFVAAPFLLRFLRVQLQRAQRRAAVSLPDGRRLTVTPGATVLETLRRHGVPHAAVCGGRGRCTTCRVRVAAGAETLIEPNDIERKALAKIQAPDGLRLACQIRPTSDIVVVPLLPPRANADDGRSAGGLEGVERPVTILFIDLRGSTKLGETKLPYDVLFILNQFFASMTQALFETNGHYAQFNGDGLMAIYGLNTRTAEQGAREALRGAQAMLDHMDRLNELLTSELPFPLEIGIGVHHGEAIVGAMGPPEKQIMSAIGDSVNTAARLEALSKTYPGPLVASETAISIAGYAPDPSHRDTVSLRGRDEEIAIFALPDAKSETLPEARTAQAAE